MDWIKVVSLPLGLAGFGLFLVFGLLKSRKNNPKWLLPVATALAAIAIAGGLVIEFTSHSPEPKVGVTNDVSVKTKSSGDHSPAINAGGSVNVIYGDKPTPDKSVSNLDGEIKGRLKAAWRRLTGLEGQIAAGVAGIDYTISDGPIYKIFALQILDAQDPEHNSVTYPAYKEQTFPSLINELQDTLPAGERKLLDQSLRSYDVLATKAEGVNKALEKGPATAAHMLSVVADAKNLIRQIGSSRWQDF